MIKENSEEEFNLLNHLSITLLLTKIRKSGDIGKYIVAEIKNSGILGSFKLYLGKLISIGNAPDRVFGCFVKDNQSKTIEIIDIDLIQLDFSTMRNNKENREKYIVLPVEHPVMEQAIYVLDKISVSTFNAFDDEDSAKLYAEVAD